METPEEQQVQIPEGAMLVQLGPDDFKDDYWQLKMQRAMIRTLQGQREADRKTIAEQAEQLAQLRALVEADTDRRVVTLQAVPQADDGVAACGAESEAG